MAPSHMVRIVEKQVLAPLRIPGLHLSGFKYVVDHIRSPASRSWLVTIDGAGKRAEHLQESGTVRKEIQRLFPGLDVTVTIEP